MAARRQFQISDSEFELRPSGCGWVVVEVWWEIDRHGEKEDAFEILTQPMGRAEAEAKAEELRAS